MKLRNLMYATMIACAFASCSKDDEVINGGETAKGDATLNVKISVPTVTKAVADGSDSSIQTLDVYVFNADGSALETTGSLTGANKSEGITVSAGTKRVVIVANASKSLATTLLALYNDTAAKSLENETTTNLSMNSKTYTVAVVAGKTNYLGYTADEAKDGVALVPSEGTLNNASVLLYRNVAKIVLSSITCNTKDASGATDAKYPNAKLKVESAFILHGNTLTKLVGGGTAWSSTEVSPAKWFNGISNDTYTGWIATVDASKQAPKQNYISNSLDYSAKESYYGNTLSTFTLNNEATSTSDQVKAAQFYAYENTDNNTRTLLIVAGRFGYGATVDAASPDNFPLRYYSVAIGHDKVSTTDQSKSLVDQNNTTVTRSINGVLRNLQYNVGLTVKGPGYETPFGPDNNADTYLNVKVEVVPFGTVSQTPVIE